MRPVQLIERSYPMMIASYWLARCGVRKGERAAAPPAALGIASWKAAYDSFYDAMGDGRTPTQFRNSMKNARDVFDLLFDNGRIGWVDRDGQPSSLRRSFCAFMRSGRNGPMKSLRCSFWHFRRACQLPRTK